jgi:hypothetical protein
MASTCLEATHTITWNPWERQVHLNDQLLSPRPVHNEGRFQVDPSVIDKLEHDRREDDGERDEGH